MTSNTTSARSIARIDRSTLYCSIPRSILPRRRMPAVSISVMGWPAQTKTVSSESRVVPGRQPVLLRRWRDATLSYKAETLPGEVYVMVGVFDNPEPFEPQTHARVTQKPEWLYIRDELPRYRESSKPQ